MGPIRKSHLVTLTAIGMSVFHLYTAQFGLFSAIVQRSIHLLFALLLIFLTIPMGGKGPEKATQSKLSTLWDFFLFLLSLATVVYLVLQFREIVMRGGATTTYDLIMGGILILLVLEATRRSLGWSLPIIALLGILYALLGDRIPGLWGHKGVDLESFVAYQFITTEGLFTVPLGVSASFIFIFILFAAFLVASGTGEFFIDFANSLTGNWRGGPAKVAIVSSGFFGTISGSSVANVVSTGSFTIPLMKKIGYEPKFAGAVEAVASTGGQFMPPVMGAAAFIMADMLGIPYIRVCLAAMIPSILYYFALFYMVHLEALKLGLKGIPKEQLPRLKKVILQRGHLILPAFLLVYLLVIGYSPMKAGFWSIWAVMGISFFKKETRIGFKKFLLALEKGAMISREVALACACAGIIIGVVTQTGLGLKFSTLVIEACKGELFLALIAVMFTSMIMGLGLTTSAAYILTVILGGPVLIKLGVDPLAAHMFVFYYACISTITPPEALTAYAGAGIAGSPPFATAFLAMRLAAIAYFIPFLFVYYPVLIWKGDLLHILSAFLTAIIGCLALGSAIQGHMISRLNWVLRLLLFIAAFTLIKPGMVSDILGGGILVAIFLLQRMKNRKR
ncbi:MAG: TRAP transporter permease [Thermodesulfobacteriota bacterium]|nr:TRAP transporter permease [Thermodesulfobacteriota bacterium]